jgi:hypothetical protein
MSDDREAKRRLEALKGSHEAKAALRVAVRSEEDWSCQRPDGTLPSRWSGIPLSLRVARKRLADGLGSPQAAIQAFCLECQGYEWAGVRACDTRACPLWHFRPT